MPQTVTPPRVPAVPRQTGPAPVWERHRLFQEPVYPDGPYDQGDEDEDPATITP
jgi:hypothetical protein